MTGCGVGAVMRGHGSLYKAEEASFVCPRRAAEDSRDHLISADWPGSAPRRAGAAATDV